MEQEEQRAVGDSGQAGSEPAAIAHMLGFFPDLLLDLLPLHAKRWIGGHVVELLVGQAIFGERVALNDVGDVLPLDEHVRLADRVGLGVEFLPVHDEPRVWIEFRDVLPADREHAAGACRRVIERPHDARLGQGLVVLDEEQVHHQPDHFARGEVLSGGFVRDFRELPDQFLEDHAHLRVADGLRVQVDGGELLADQIQQPGFREPVDLGVELERLEDVPDGRGERLDVGVEIFLDVVLIPHQLLHVEGRVVEEQLTGLLQQERLGVHLRLLALGVLGQHGGLGFLQHAVESAQHGEWQDHLAVFGLLVVAPEEISDGPDERREIGVGHDGLGFLDGSGCGLESATKLRCRRPPE